MNILKNFFMMNKKNVGRRYCFFCFLLALFFFQIEISYAASYCDSTTIHYSNAVSDQKQNLWSAPAGETSISVSNSFGVSARNYYDWVIHCLYPVWLGETLTINTGTWNHIANAPFIGNTITKDYEGKTFIKRGGITIKTFSHNFTKDLAWNESEYKSNTWKPTQVGTYIVEMNLDTSNVISEYTKRDNVSYRTVVVYEPKPDLIVGLEPNNWNPSAGDTVTLTATYRNRGPKDSGKFVVAGAAGAYGIKDEDYISYPLMSVSNALGHKSVSQLNSQDFGSFTFDYVVEKTPGVQYVSVCVDIENNVDELKERNNCQFIEFNVRGVPPSAPTVRLRANPTSIAEGGNTTLSWTVTGASSCTASSTASGSGSWSGSKSPTGGPDQVGPISFGALSSHTYTLTCTGNGYTTSDTAIVSKTAPASNTLTLKENTCSGTTLGSPVYLPKDASITIAVCDKNNTLVSPSSWNISGTQTAFTLTGSNTSNTRTFTAKGSDGQSIYTQATKTGYTASSRIQLIVDNPTLPSLVFKKGSNCLGLPIVNPILEVTKGETQTLSVCEKLRKVNPSSWNVTSNTNKFTITPTSDTIATRDFKAIGNNEDTIGIRAEQSGYSSSWPLFLRVVDTPPADPKQLIIKRDSCSSGESSQFNLSEGETTTLVACDKTNDIEVSANWTSGDVSCISLESTTPSQIMSIKAIGTKSTCPTFTNITATATDPTYRSDSIPVGIRSDTSVVPGPKPAQPSIWKEVAP